MNGPAGERSDAQPRGGPRFTTPESEERNPSQDSWSLANSVVNRLQPKDPHEMGQMIHSRSVMAGTLFAAVGIFWWLTVSVIGGTLGDADPTLPTSMIFGLEFFSISLIIPLLVLLATILLMHSRERSNWKSGTLGGILLIIALYFTLEPLGWIVFTDQGDPKMVLQSLRIGALAIMVHFATHMLLDAILLSWVMKLMTNFGIDYKYEEEQLLLPEHTSEDEGVEASPM